MFRTETNGRIVYNSEYFEELNERAVDVGQWALRLESRSSQAELDSVSRLKPTVFGTCTVFPSDHVDLGE
eukprot:scaffold4829_cov129-Cylindrotheca_fusiformis.AAC.2